MEQDLRNLFEEQRKNEKPLLKNGHEDRFLKRLEEEFPVKKKPTYSFMKIAIRHL